MVTSEVRDGKLYILCFEELAEFLVFNSRYKVLFCSYGLPAIIVNQNNFEYCKKLHKEGEGTSDHNFICELGLPALEVKISDNHFSVNSNPRYRTSFHGLSFEDVNVWRENEIERRLKELGSYQQLEKVREEVDQLIKTLPIDYAKEI